ncbi:SidA/IucD/PvdA family monooxygenase [Vibrio cholerae]|nr:SidA/IucD/PvdA family monooxygenase [Vibrio cholerae]EGR5448326.1 L-lysine 6-monooxygenase [Vibrio cholerae]EGR5456669.1 L-lysine 6-monooxygenase [Vibrio cholerae]EGR5464303.1 L-lysine 6-monooxygenase [Vibrio cholerae]
MILFTNETNETKEFELVGIGCGPSNLSVASLLHNKPEITNIFFDQKPSFAWHDGMMLKNTSLQVSMFKDLVTLADPTNKFSFVSYLHHHGRLLQFLNSKFDQISRLEFADYLKWAAENNSNVCFNESVNSIDFNGEYFIINTSRRRVLGKHVVIGAGITPYVPQFVSDQLDCDTNFHIHEFARRQRNFDGKKVVVVGGGQSGAEAVLELLNRTGNNAPREIIWLSRRENFFPIDDSPFTNDFFTPSHSNYFFEQDPNFRNSFLERNVLASDGISEHTLRDIYQRIYFMRYIERSPVCINLMPSRDVNMINRKGSEWKLKVKHLYSNHSEFLSSDVIIWATGFQSAPMPFLSPLDNRIERTGNEVLIDKDYSAIWDGPRDRKIFFLNSARSQRGLAEPNLSLTAWRSQIVVNKILGRQASSLPIDDAFVKWAAPSSITAISDNAY